MISRSRNHVQTNFSGRHYALNQEILTTETHPVFSKQKIACEHAH